MPTQSEDRAVDDARSTRPGAPDQDPTDGPGHRMPGWVKAFIVVAVAMVVLVVLVLVVGGSDHGPARHLPGGGAEMETPAGHTPPVDR